MRTVCAVYGLSGLVSLAYQVAWFRIFAHEFGSTNLTFVLVLCCFIGGLGTGALVSARITAGVTRALRLRSPLRVYGAIEVMIATSILLTVLATSIPADAWGAFPYTMEDGIFRPSIGLRLSSVAVAAACVFLPCVLMGVTFPLLCAAFPAEGRFPSLLYGWNTLGACSGVLLCEFVFLPRIGHGRTLLLVMAVNLALGLFFLVHGGAAPDAAGTPPRTLSRAPGREADVAGMPYSALLFAAVISGLLTGAVEGDVFKRVRFLGGAAEVAMSFISFWAILAIFLGSWTVRAARRLTFPMLKTASAAAVVIYGATWIVAAPGRGEPVWSALGKGLLGLLAFTGLFVFPAFLLLSLLLPWVCNRVQASGRHLGFAYGANTVAFCVGVVAFTWVAPAVNIFYSLKLAMAVLVILAVVLAFLRVDRPVSRWLPVGALAALALAAVFTSTRFERRFFPPTMPPARYPIRAMMSNAAHTTYIVEEPDGDVLYFTHHPMSGTSPGAQLYMRLMAHFPLLAQPEPKTALLICFGVGNTASAIAMHDTIERLDVVDLNANVFATAPEFAATNQGVIADPRLELVNDDGRNFLRRTDRRYDLVTSEPPPPQHEGVYRLYSREYYASVREHLTPAGMMSQWLPIYQMSPEAVARSITSFVDSFPYTLLFVGQTRNYILLGSNSPIDLHLIETRFDASTRVRQDLATLGIRRPLELLARTVQGDRSLRRQYADAAGISDQRNDLSHTLLDPSEPSLIVYDPVAMLEEIEASRLAGEDELRNTVMDLARLKSVVPDFPISALMSVRTTGATGVAYADADWTRNRRLRVAARSALEQNQLASAAGLLRQALEIVPELPSTLMDLGRIELRLGEYEAALETLERLVALAPETADGQYGIGYALARLGRAREALPYLELARTLDPDAARYARTLGEVLAMLGRFQAAVEAYDLALAIDPADEATRRKRTEARSRVR